MAQVAPEPPKFDVNTGQPIQPMLPAAPVPMQMMQPGMMQPGMMQPGMQPGMMQPGMMQPGMMQPVPAMWNGRPPPNISGSNWWQKYKIYSDCECSSPGCYGFWCQPCSYGEVKEWATDGRESCFGAGLCFCLFSFLGPCVAACFIEDARKKSEEKIFNFHYNRGGAPAAKHACEWPPPCLTLAPLTPPLHAPSATADSLATMQGGAGNPHEGLACYGWFMFLGGLGYWIVEVANGMNQGANQEVMETFKKERELEAGMMQPGMVQPGAVMSTPAQTTPAQTTPAQTTPAPKQPSAGKFDVNTGQPIPKFNTETGEQNW